MDPDFLKVLCHTASVAFPCRGFLSQTIKLDLDKKLDPKQKTIQAFNIDA